MTQQELIKRLETTCFGLDPIDPLRLLVDDVIAALAQPEQEPVALHVYKPTLPRGHLGNVSDGDLPWVYDQDPSSGYSARMLVHTTPPQRKPLTHEQRLDLLYKFEAHKHEWHAHSILIDMVEAAHNIQEST